MRLNNLILGKNAICRVNVTLKIARYLYAFFSDYLRRSLSEINIKYAFIPFRRDDLSQFDYITRRADCCRSMGGATVRKLSDAVDWYAREHFIPLDASPSQSTNRIEYGPVSTVRRDFARRGLNRWNMSLELSQLVEHVRGMHLRTPGAPSFLALGLIICNFQCGTGRSITRPRGGEATAGGQKAHYRSRPCGLLGSIKAEPPINRWSRMAQRHKRSTVHA